MDGNVTAEYLRHCDVNRICWAALAAAPGPFTFTQADVFLTQRALQIPGNAAPNTVPASPAVKYLGDHQPVEEITIAQINHISARKEATFQKVNAAWTLQQNIAAHGKH